MSGPLRLTALALCLSTAIVSAGRAHQESAGEAELARRLLDTYERGIRPEVRFSDSRSLLRGLEAVAPAWIESAPAGRLDRRRQLLALLTLELSTTGATPSAILEFGCKVLRQGETSPFEHEWMLATAAIAPKMYLGARQTADLKHFEHGLSRFPGDPRLRLEAIFLRPEAYTVSNRPGVDSLRLRRSQGDGLIESGAYMHENTTARTPTDLAALFTDDEVGAEARVHRGVLLFLQNKLREAQADFEVARAARDPFVRNLASLYIGLILDREHRMNDALDAYRAAVTALPTAKSSATALATRLFLGGQRDEAASVLQAAYSADPPAIDPWRTPVASDRLLPDRMRRLRELLGRGDATVASWTEIGPPPSSPFERSIFAHYGDVFRSVLRLDGMTTAPTSTTPSVFELPATSRPQDVGSNLPGRLTFRATSSGVIVDVAVTSGKTPTLGLTASDFEVFDDGVRQAVNVAAIDAVPLDVTLVLDLASPSMSLRVDESSIGTPAPRVQGYPPVRAFDDAGKIIERLRPTDRVRVLLANVAPYELLPLVPARAGILADRRITLGERWNGHYSSSIYDALVAALMQQTPSDRRHLILMFTDGIDGTSITMPSLLTDVASRSDGVVYLARNDTGEEVSQRKRPPGSFTESDQLLWPMDVTVVERATVASGGVITHLAQFPESIVPEAERILASFRQRYILHYQPKGVTDRGWHTITVKVAKPGKYDVQARRGYWAG